MKKLLLFFLAFPLFLLVCQGCNLDVNQLQTLAQSDGFRRSLLGVVTFITALLVWMKGGKLDAETIVSGVMNLLSLLGVLPKKKKDKQGQNDRKNGD